MEERKARVLNIHQFITQTPEISTEYRENRDFGVHYSIQFAMWIKKHFYIPHSEWF